MKEAGCARLSRPSTKSTMTVRVHDLRAFGFPADLAPRLNEDQWTEIIHDLFPDWELLQVGDKTH